MRMSDWSSDVCSSDLAREGPRVRPRPHEPLATLDGRLWVGSLTSDKAHPAATLYRLDPDGSLTEILHGLTTSNGAAFSPDGATRSEEHTSELQSLMRISYAVFCLKKKKTTKHKQ